MRKVITSILALLFLFLIFSACAFSQMPPDPPPTDERITLEEVHIGEQSTRLWAAISGTASESENFSGKVIGPLLYTGPDPGEDNLDLEIKKKANTIACVISASVKLALSFWGMTQKNAYGYTSGGLFFVSAARDLSEIYE